MNILYIFAHPSSHSLNTLLKEITLDIFKNAEVSIELSDLYQQHWNAVASFQDFQSPENTASYLQAQKQASQDAGFSEDILNAQARLLNADHIILQFPLWWFSAPAIIKGWFDRVLAKGIAYDAGQIFEKGKLVGKTASLVVTTQSPESAYQPSGLHGDTLPNFLKPITHTLRFTGIEILPSYFIYDALTMTENRLQTIKQNYNQYLNKLIQSLKSR